MELSNQKSLDIITEMIQITKKSIKADGYYFLLWGWIVLAGTIGHYFLMKFTDFKYPYVVWLIVVPGWILSILHGYKQRKLSIVRTHLSKLIAVIWITFIVNYIIILCFIHKLNFYINPLILIYGASALILTGIVVKERILILGSIFLWIGGILSFYFTMENQLIIGSISVILGYLIPGYIIRNKYKKENV